MSGFASKLQMGAFFNRSANAGPRRFIIIGGGIVLVAAAIICVSVSGSNSPLTSQLTRLPPVNSLPGGLQSDPMQDKLALATNQEQAEQAARRGLSYTPPIAASQPLVPRTTAPPVALAVSAPAEPPAPLAGTQPLPTPAAQPLRYMPNPIIHQVAQTTQVDPQEQEAYGDAVRRLLRGWVGRSPRTDIQIQPKPGDDLATAASGQSEEDGGSIRTGSTGSRFAGRSSGGAAAVQVTLACGPRRVCPHGSRGLVGFRRSGGSAGRFWSACGRSDDRVVRQGDVERLWFGGSFSGPHQHNRASGTKHWRRCDRHGARNHGNDSREQRRSALSRALRPSRGGGLRGRPGPGSRDDVQHGWRVKPAWGH